MKFLIHILTLALLLALGAGNGYAQIAPSLRLSSDIDTTLHLVETANKKLGIVEKALKDSTKALAEIRKQWPDYERTDSTVKQNLLLTKKDEISKKLEFEEKKQNVAKKRKNLQTKDSAITLKQKAADNAGIDSIRAVGQYRLQITESNQILRQYKIAKATANNNNDTTMVEIIDTTQTKLDTTQKKQLIAEKQKIDVARKTYYSKQLDWRNKNKELLQEQADVKIYSDEVSSAVKDSTDYENSLIKVANDRKKIEQDSVNCARGLEALRKRERDLRTEIKDVLQPAIDYWNGVIKLAKNSENYLKEKLAISDTLELLGEFGAQVATAGAEGSPLGTNFGVNYARKSYRSAYQFSAGISLGSTGETITCKYISKDSITDGAEFRNRILQPSRGNNAPKSGYIDFKYFFCPKSKVGKSIGFNISANYCNRNVSFVQEKTNETNTTNFNMFSVNVGLLFKIIPEKWKDISAYIYGAYTGRFLTGDMVASQDKDMKTFALALLGTEKKALHGIDFGLSLSYKNVTLYLNCIGLYSQPDAGGVTGLRSLQGFTNLAYKLSSPQKTENKAKDDKK